MTTNFNTAFSAGTAERLMKSADSLDFALQGTNKKITTTSLSRQGLIDFGGFDILGGGVGDISATLFDDWLANDLQQAGFLSHDDSLNSSSDSDNSPLISNEIDSPVIGFDSITSDTELIQSSEFDASLALFPEVQTQAASPVFVSTPAVAATPAPMLPLTPEAVQQAAAALNIPWSKSLETAVLAQSLLASIPMALQMSFNKPSATPSAPAAPVAQATPAPTPSPVLSPKIVEKISSPISVASPVIAERASSATPSVPSTPRMSLSILSSTQTPVPGSNAVKATTYKSAYRSASLPRSSLKRDRDFDEPPSVLDGKDVSEMDEVALKRAKNTDAARRSRHKKLVKMEGLEQRVAELEIENSMFETKLNEVELERSLLADKDQMQQARIQELEKMLSAMREKLY